MADLQALANEYLVTPDGRTADEPCGAWCGDGDVTIWHVMVQRIGAAMRTLIQANKGVTFPPELMGNTVRWMFASRKFKGGNITHVFGAGTDEVIGLVAFARHGVQLLYELQTAVEAGGGTVTTPGPLSEPPKDPGLPGPDELWYLGGGVVLTLIILAAWRGR